MATKIEDIAKDFVDDFFNSSNRECTMCQYFDEEADLDEGVWANTSTCGLYESDDIGECIKCPAFQEWVVKLAFEEWGKS